MEPIQDPRSFETFARALFSAPEGASAVPPHWPAKRVDSDDLVLADTGRPKALVVEDVDYHRVRLTRMLSSLGFEAFSANTANDALRVLGLRLPALVLIDWLLPDANGLVVAHAIRQMKGAQPVVIGLGTQLSEEIRELALSSGMDAFCEKPVSLDELAACLCRCALPPPNPASPAGVSLELENIRGFSRGRSLPAQEVYRAFIDELLVESDRVATLLQEERFAAATEKAEKLLWRASLVGSRDFMDLVRAIQRSASAVDPDAAELAHALQVESRRLADQLRRALQTDAMPA